MSSEFDPSENDKAKEKWKTLTKLIVHSPRPNFDDFIKSLREAYTKSNSPSFNRSTSKNKIISIQANGGCKK
jgi:hypothetical protein